MTAPSVSSPPPSLHPPCLASPLSSSHLSFSCLCPSLSRSSHSSSIIIFSLLSPIHPLMFFPLCDFLLFHLIFFHSWHPFFHAFTSLLQSFPLSVFLSFIYSPLLLSSSFYFLHVSDAFFLPQSSSSPLYLPFLLSSLVASFPSFIPCFSPQIYFQLLSPQTLFPQSTPPPVSAMLVQCGGHCSVLVGVGWISCERGPLSDLLFFFFLNCQDELQKLLLPSVYVITTDLK